MVLKSQALPLVKATMRAILDRTIFLLLLCFFVSRVVISLMRVEEGKVGLSQGKVRSNRVQYPSISLCFNSLGHVNVSLLASGEADQVMNVTERLESLYFGGIVDDRWGTTGLCRKRSCFAKYEPGGTRQNFLAT